MAEAKADRKILVLVASAERMSLLLLAFTKMLLGNVIVTVFPEP